MRKKRESSIRVRTFVPLVLLVLLQTSIFVATILLSGTMRKLEDSSYATLTSQVLARRNRLQESLARPTQGARETAEALERDIAALFGEELKAEHIRDNPQVVYQALEESFPTVVEFLQYNSVGGAFITLDGTSVFGAQPGLGCVYIRDVSPGTVSLDGGDLILECGPSSIAKDHGISLDSFWTHELSADNEADERAFFYRPMEEARKNRAYDKGLLGYWGAPFRLTPNDIRVVTYSIPLRDTAGEPFGVFGFELSEEIVSSYLPYAEIPVTNAFYLLAVRDEGTLYTQDCITSGAMGLQFLASKNAEILQEDITERQNSAVRYLFTADRKNHDTISADIPLRMYSAGSPYTSQEWSLYLAAPRSSLFSGMYDVIRAIVYSLLVAIIAGIVVALFVGNYISSPIRWLSEKVRAIDPERPVEIEETGMKEIDELSSALVGFSKRIGESAARMSKVVDLMGLPIGSFEVNYDTGRVFLTDSVFRITGFMKTDGNSNVSLADWNAFLDSMELIEKSDAGDGGPQNEIYLQTKKEFRNWYRIRSVSEGRRMLGMVMDITDEMVQMQRLEYERNFDPLTKLLNRLAFVHRAETMISESSGAVGIAAFSDLDNLQFINDSYGHDFGDRYIQKAAEVLTVFRESGGAVARISGDEFAIYLHGFRSKSEARKRFDELFSDVRLARLLTPDSKTHKIRMSVGLSYYPEDASAIDDLLKFADFAMYEIKHSIKGSVKEFDRVSYGQNAYLLEKNDLLNRFLDEERVRYVFQPIVDAKTGDIFAYEALMRPQMREFKSPEEILQLARTQSKLYQVELLTVHVVMDWLRQNASRLDGRKMFFNSIPNQLLSVEDMRNISEEYNGLFLQTVVEITENEHSGKEHIEKKIAVLRKLGATIAIDDFGAGYSNELVLLSTSPDYIKIDMTIVRDIDKDTDRQQLVKNTISYAKSRGIRIIAEGIETGEEMETLCRFGVDYLQGFYLALPEAELQFEISKDVQEAIRECGNKDD